MRKLNTVFFLLLLSQLAIGQEFSFKMYFEDAIGNKDTLELGYDVNATDTIDAILGEINIIGIPLDSVFDIRISDAYWNNNVGTFQTKKQIVQSNNCRALSFITIDLKCNNWPVTATWDNSVSVILAVTEACLQVYILVVGGILAVQVIYGEQNY